MSNQQKDNTEHNDSSSSTSALTTTLASSSSHHFQILKTMLDKFDISSFSSYIEKEEQSKDILNLLLIYALQLINHNQILTYEIIDFLLSKGASPDIFIQFSYNQYFIDEKNKVTLLLFSLLTKDIDLFSIVIKYSPNIKLRDAKNLNAMLYYVLYNRDDDVKMLQDLIDLNADVNSNAEVEISPNVCEWHSVFTIACKNNMMQTIKVLIDNGVELNYITNLNRNTGLHLALIEDHIELVSMLIRVNGIRLDIVNKDGLKAIDIAKMKGKEVLALFTHQYYVNDKEHNDNNNNDTLSNTTKTMMTQGQAQVQSPSVEEGRDLIGNKESNNGNGNNMKKKDSVTFSSDTNNYQSNNSPLSPPFSNTINTNSDKQYNSKTDANHKYKQQHNLAHVNSYKIPIEFKERTGSSSYLSISNPPLLCLDLPSITIELEAKIKELTLQLSEGTQVLNKLEDNLQQSNSKNSDLTKIYELKDSEINSINQSEKERQIEIKEIWAQNEALKKKLAAIPQPVKREMTKKEYIDLKFQEIKYDETYVIKSLQRDLIDYRNLIQDEIIKKRIVVNQLISNLQSAVSSINPEYEVVLFGSYSTGLCLPWSDIDVVLVNKAGKPPQDNFLLRKLYSVLITKKSWISETKLIETAFIPIIKLVSTDQYLSFKIDISIEDEKHFGLKCVQLVKSYLKEYDILEALIIALKTILQNANLNDPYVGGMSSYGLILMVVSFIQNQSNTQNELVGEDKLGKAFVKFLEHFGLYFDFSKYVILTYPINDTNNSTYEQDISFGNTHELIIVDPLNKQNNVAKTSYQFNNIKMAFMIAYMVTKEDCECGCHYGGANNDNEYFATEHCILKRMFNSVKRYSESNSK